MSASSDTALVELMAGAAYEAGRTGASTRPAWANTEPTWREAAQAEMAAAIRAAEARGYRIDKPQAPR